MTFRSARTRFRDNLTLTLVCGLYLGLFALLSVESCIHARAQTPAQETVQGNLSGLSDSTNDVLQARFTLANCGTANPVISGVTVIVPKLQLFTADSSGNFSGALWGNDQISCNLGMTTVYQVQYLRNHIPTGVPEFYRVTSLVQPFDLTAAQPVATLPSVNLPASGYTCPVGQVLTGILSDWTPVCQTFTGPIGPAGSTTATGTNGAFAVPGTFTAQSVNAVQNAALFPGSDIGAKINAAFAACASPLACKVTVPSGSYSYATSVQLPSSSTTPSIVAPTLDLGGATLVYTGTGDAIVVHGENAAGPHTTGGIYNGTIMSATPHSPTVTSLIHIKDRIGFTLWGLHLENAQNCVDWENTNTDGGPGYNEQDDFEHIESVGCANHLYSHATTGGTGSFEYNRITDWHITLQNYNGTEKGWYLGPGTIAFDTQGGNFDFKINTQGNAGGAIVSVIYIDGGNSIFRSVVNMHGEDTGNLNNGSIIAFTTYVENGIFYNSGDAVVASMNPFVNTASKYNRYVMHPPTEAVVTDLGVDYPIHFEDEDPLGGAPERLCKYDIGHSVRFWMAEAAGTENDCEFQILGRATDNAHPDVYQANGGNAPYNILYTSSLGLIGIGPGFGDAATGGELPKATLDVHGSFAISNPTFSGSDTGIDATRSFDSNGNILDRFHGELLPGQPSFHYIQVFYDPQTYTNDNGLDCYAATGVHCTIPDLHVTTFTDAGGGTFGGPVIAPSVTPANGFTGTKTAGSCVLTITAGIITNVTGC